MNINIHDLYALESGSHSGESFTVYTRGKRES